MIQLGRFAGERPVNYWWRETGNRTLAEEENAMSKFRNSHVSLALAAACLLAVSACTPQKEAVTTVDPSFSAPKVSSVVAKPDGVKAHEAGWQFVQSSEVNAKSKKLRISVSRVGCAGGKTGNIYQPTVTESATEIRILTEAEPLKEGAYTCPSNDFVEVTLTLAAPIGTRKIVDPICDDKERKTHSYCMDNGVRWDPKTGASTVIL